MKIIIQKFGGTSVSTKEKRQSVVRKIKRAKQEGFFPVVVVSAMGRNGEPYATDTLMSLISEELKEKNPLATDLLLSCGETISTVVMCDELQQNGVEAIPLMGGQAGIITDAQYNSAEILTVKIERILEIMKTGKVPVVAGFQGKSKEEFITTIGRGGSDVSAAILGAALKAESVEIYTDVDGIMTADPRIVSDASLIKEISYDEIFQFADQGAKVIHPRAVEIAKRYNIPLVIKNTMNDGQGTIISQLGKVASDKIITGITHMTDRVQVKVPSDLVGEEDLFEILAEQLISIDLINIFPKEKIFTIDAKDLEKFKATMEKISMPYTYIKDCSKIAVIGSKMRGIPGVMARILRALIREKIEVLQTADSHMTIWCLVESKHIAKAINALHKEFELG